MPADLLIIVPTVGRPGNIAELLAAWQATATDQADILIALDGDAVNEPAYRRICDAAGVRCEIAPWQGMCPTLNHWASESVGAYRYIGFMGDDHRPRTPGWDRSFIDALRGMGAGIAYADDLYMGQRLPTHVVMTAGIIDALGYMVPPGILHQYCDNFWLGLGEAADCIRYLPDVVVEHMHPLADKASWDIGYGVANHSARRAADRLALAAYIRDGWADDLAKVKALNPCTPKGHFHD